MVFILSQKPQNPNANAGFRHFGQKGLITLFSQLLYSLSIYSFFIKREALKKPMNTMFYFKKALLVSTIRNSKKSSILQCRIHLSQKLCKLSLYRQMYWSLNSLEQQAYSEIANRSLSSFTLNFTLESVDSSCKRMYLCLINSFPNKGKEKLKQ